MGSRPACQIEPCGQQRLHLGHQVAHRPAVSGGRILAQAQQPAKAVGGQHDGARCVQQYQAFAKPVGEVLHHLVHAAGPLLVGGEHLDALLRLRQGSSVVNGRLRAVWRSVYTFRSGVRLTPRLPLRKGEGKPADSGRYTDLETALVDG